MPDQAYLDKYKKTFGVPWAGVYRGVVSFPEAGDSSSATVNAQGNYAPQIQPKPPMPAPVPLPVTPAPPVGGSPPIIAIPGGRRHRGQPPWRPVGGMPHDRRRHGRGGYDWGHRHRHDFGPRPRPLPVDTIPPPGPAPVAVAPPPAPVPVPVAPTGKPCPTWGWAVSTNPDGSETVHQCHPGDPMAPGLHGLDGLTDTMQGILGPNWMLYLGLGIGAWFLLKKMR